MASHPGVSARRHDGWQLGAFLPFSAYPLQSLDVPPRVQAYLQAHSKLGSHRLGPPADTPVAEHLVERLFFNEQICGRDGKPLRGSTWAAWVEAGVTSLWDLRAHIQRGRPELPHWEAMLASLPPCFSAAVGLPALHSAWLLGEGAAGSQAFHVSGAGVVRYGVGTTGKLTPEGSELSGAGLPGAHCQPALVLAWDEGRSYRGSTTYAEARGVPYLLGPLSSVSLNPARWGRGTFPAHALVVKLSTQRQLLLASKRDPTLRLQPGQALKPAIWSSGCAAASAGLRSLEEHWAGEAAGEPREVQYLSQLFLPSQPRAPPRDRSAAVAEAAPLASQQPRDELDPAATRPRSLLSRAYTRVWEEIGQPDISRPARLTAWKLLHGSLMVGAFRQHVHRGTLPQAEAVCAHPCCQDIPATLSHTFLACPLVAPVIEYLQAVTYCA